MSIRERKESKRVTVDMKGSKKVVVEYGMRYQNGEGRRQDGGRKGKWKGGFKGKERKWFIENE